MKIIAVIVILHRHVTVHPAVFLHIGKLILSYQNTSLLWTKLPIE